MRLLPIEEIKLGMQIVTEDRGQGFEVHTVEEIDEDGLSIIDQHGYNIYPHDEDDKALYAVCNYKYEYTKALAEKKENDDAPEPCIDNGL